MFIIIAIVIGLIPAAIARSKGRSFALWWLYGALLWIVALPHALLLKVDQHTLDRQAEAAGMKKCPFCAEMIREEAAVCRFCQREQPQIA
jgi:hypothetical protein